MQTAGTGASLTVDGQPVVSGGILALLGTTLHRTTDGLANSFAHLNLTAGPHTISVTAAPIPAFPPFIEASSGPVQIRLAWITPQQRQANLAAAAAAARRARTAVVFAYMEGTEGVDQPTLALPDEQDQLIEAVARANPRTVVVLNSGYPVLMPWVNEVRAILDMWYPGQEGGRATADLLVGAAVPGGKLPVTFPARESDAPTATSPLRYPGVNGQEYYSEGIFVGYRWYDQQRIAPLFPFGYGLSYTSFGYRHAAGAGRPTEGIPRVRFTLTNTGPRTGTEVAQVYVGRLPTSLPTPVKQLAGVARVTLGPGESRTVTVSLDRLSLSYWDSQADRWVTPAGRVDGARRELVAQHPAARHPHHPATRLLTGGFPGAVSPAPGSRGGTGGHGYPCRVPGCWVRAHCGGSRRTVDLAAHRSIRLLRRSGAETRIAGLGAGPGLTGYRRHTCW